MTGQRGRWAEPTGGRAGEEYVQRFARLAAAGHDVHGEPAFCAASVEPAAKVRQRYAAWSGDPYREGGGYAVGVHAAPTR